MACYGIYVDVKRCTGCYSCVVGCKNWHQEEATEGGRIRITDIVDGNYPDIIRWIFPVLCMQCEDPPCMEVCPGDAIRIREDGIVVIDRDECTGCKACVEACPYNACSFDEIKEKAVKCDFCAERIDNAQLPYCVEICPTDALIFGDMDDPDSKISRLLKSEKTEVLLPEQGARPNVFYANMDLDPRMTEKATNVLKQDNL